MEYQQNQACLPVGVIVLLAPSNKLESFLPLVSELLRTLDGFVPNTLMVLPKPDEPETMAPVLLPST